MASLFGKVAAFARSPQGQRVIAQASAKAKELANDPKTRAKIDQARGRFLGAEQLLDAFSAEVPDWPTSEVRTLLAKFGLVAEHVLRPAATLSPGERTRAALALLQARGINVLVLDEPTNHLDLPAIEQLEQALASYEGTLLLVTHDRRMLEAVRTTRRLAVVDGRVVEA